MSRPELGARTQSWAGMTVRSQSKAGTIVHYHGAVCQQRTLMRKEIVCVRTRGLCVARQVRYEPGDRSQTFGYRQVLCTNSKSTLPRVLPLHRKGFLEHSHRCLAHDYMTSWFRPTGCG